MREIFIEKMVLDSGFNTILKLTPCGKHGYKLLEPYLDIPAGFVTDGASIPRLFWFICYPFDSRYIEEFVRHDFEYKLGLVPRITLDRSLDLRLKVKGMSKWCRLLIYHGVRLFGARYYKG